MNHRPWASRLGLSLGLTAILAFASSLSTALAEEDGWYIETTNRSTGLTGEMPREEISKTYVAHGKMKVVSGDEQGTDMIIDPAAGTMTFLNGQVKQYYLIDTTHLKEGMSQPGMEQMRAVLEQSSTSVEPTDETKVINGWNCRKYNVHKTGMMEVEQEIWTTEDVDLDLSPYTNMMTMSGAEGLLADSPVGKARREEMAKIKGLPILTKSQVNMLSAKMETETEVTLIRQEPIPADLFEIPEDYTPKDMHPVGTPSAHGAH